MPMDKQKPSIKDRLGRRKGAQKIIGHPEPCRRKTIKSFKSPGDK